MFTTELYRDLSEGHRADRRRGDSRHEPMPLWCRWHQSRSGCAAQRGCVTIKR